MDGVSDVRSGREGEDASMWASRKVRWAIAGAVEDEIKRCADAGVAFPTFAAVAARLGTSSTTVCRTLAALEGARRIDRQSRKYDGHNLRYRVLPDGAWTAWRPSILGDSASDSPSLADCGVKVLGPTLTGLTALWPGAPDGKIVAPRPAPAPEDGLYAADLVTILRDRRAALVTQRDKIWLAIEHIDGLLHFLAPEGGEGEGAR